MIVLSNSEVTFFREGEDAAFCLSLYIVLIVYSIAVLEQ